MSAIQMTEAVWAAHIVPAQRKLVALRLAEVHDSHDGLIEVTMKMVADRASMGINQARTHVHALVAEGILEVVANAHGGVPGKAPRYRFAMGRLGELKAPVGSTPDLFSEWAVSSPAVPRYRFSYAGHDLEAALGGAPGYRVIQFRDLASGAMGQADLKKVLHRPAQAGGWDGVLQPAGASGYSDADILLDPQSILGIAHWAQAAALGRVESVVTI